MKKIFQVAMFMCLCISTAFAQYASKETVGKAIDKLNCLATQNSVTESKKVWKCDCSTNPSYDVIKSSIPADLSNTSALSDEINKIKGQNVPTAKDDLIKYLSEDVFTNQAQFAKLYAFAAARGTNKAYKDWKKKLKTEITNIVSNSTSESKQPANETVLQPPIQDKPVVEQVVASKDDNVESAENKDESVASKGIFTFEIDVVSIILMILLGIVIIKWGSGVSKKTKDITKSVKECLDNKNKGNNASLSNQGNMSSGYSSKEITILREEVRQLKRDIEFLKNKLYVDKVPFEVNQPKTEDPYTERKIPTNEPKVGNETIFLSTPNNEGSFNDSSSSTIYKDGASIYKFIKTSPSEANFQIDERESSIKMAMQFPEKNILPVCDSENEYEPKFNKVRTIEQGKVSLEGGKWNVKRKAKIRYES